MKTRMRMMLAMMLVVLAGIFSPLVRGEDALGPDEYYLAYNVWYEKPSKVYVINYSRGTFLPIGTRLTFIKATEGSKASMKLKLTDGTELTVLMQPKFYPGVTMAVVKERMLTKTPAATLLAGLPEAQQKAVQRGELMVGMSRETVRRTFGYPASHVTFSLDASTYMYWQGRYNKIQVTFDAAGNVESIKD